MHSITVRLKLMIYYSPLSSISRSFKSINPDTFYEILQESFEEISDLGIDLRAAIEGFMRQEINSVVTVHRYPNNILSVVKKPMAMPFNFMTSTMAEPSKINWLLSGGFVEVVATPSPDTYDWFLFNVDQFGFYRVNYDADNWRALIKALRDNPQVFTTTTRAQLIDDALSLAQDGFLSYSIALDLVMDLDAETSFLPWNAAMKNLLQLNHLLADSDIHHDFQVSVFVSKSSSLKSFL